MWSLKQLQIQWQLRKQPQLQHLLILGLQILIPQQLISKQQLLLIRLLQHHKLKTPLLNLRLRHLVRIQPLLMRLRHQRHLHLSQLHLLTALKRLAHLLSSKTPLLPQAIVTKLPQQRRMKLPLTQAALQTLLQASHIGRTSNLAQLRAL